MKTALTMMILGFGLTAFAGNEIPENYELSCWDRTFAYNRLQAQNKDGKLNLTISGQDAEVFARLLDLSEEPRWGELRVSTSIAVESCWTSAHDKKILTCAAEMITFEATDSNGSQQMQKKIKVKNGMVQLRKLSEMTDWGKESSGYELVISNHQFSKIHLLTQKYYHGMGGDESDNCVLK